MAISVNSDNQPAGRLLASPWLPRRSTVRSDLRIEIWGQGRMTTVQRMLQDLERKGITLISQPGDGAWVVTAMNGRVLAPPLRLSVTPHSFDACLEHLAADGAEVFPGLDGREAAYRLLMVHLEEALECADPHGPPISLAGQGVTYASKTSVADPLGQAAGFWTPQRPPGPDA